jgi:glyoxylase I family protein
MEFMHIGVPTKKVQPDETYAEGMKLHLTDPDVHEMKFEYLRFEPGSWLPAIMQVNPHIAVKVDSIQDELKKCDEVLVDPLAVSENKSIAFAIRDGVIFEFMELKQA